MFKLRIARTMRDVAPGASDEALVFRVPALVLRRRTQSRFLAFADVQVLPPRCDVAVQAVMERTRWRADRLRWECVALSETGAAVAFVGVLGLSLTGVPSLYVHSLEVLRVAPVPDSVVRMARAFASGLVTRQQATFALACNAVKLEALIRVLATASSSVRHKVLAVWARRMRGAPPRRSRKRPARVTEADAKALSLAESLPCYRRWRVEAEEEDDSVAARASLGRLEPARNLPSGVGWERVLYADTKKSPQVKWMTSRAVRILERMGRIGTCPRHVIDVGGGRGDLSLAVAAALGAGSLVTVVDTNSESLAAGRARAVEEGLLSAMRFVDDDIVHVVESHELHCDLVIGLHACGGLGEYAVALAVESAASFIICTCCFNSNPHLALLTRRGSSQLSLDVVRTLCRLAEKPTDPPGVSRAAMQAVNAVRLSVIEDLFAKKHPDKRLELHQAMFPSKYSRANCVIIGEVIPH
jgi:SAM-dependent methyltransferase